jgi:hypothetical protein
MGYQCKAITAVGLMAVVLPVAIPLAFLAGRWENR